MNLSAAATEDSGDRREPSSPGTSGVAFFAASVIEVRNSS
ncbi:Uncharacterised protein [Mycobacteroides abscessus subsp. abscessus]|nr:Uncharacterised protein [Mycobacteroides abscessus subsp. abscessus]